MLRHYYDKKHIALWCVSLCVGSPGEWRAETIMVAAGWPETNDWEEVGETNVPWGVVMTKPAAQNEMYKHRKWEIITLYWKLCENWKWCFFFILSLQFEMKSVLEVQGSLSSVFSFKSSVFTHELNDLMHHCVVRFRITLMKSKFILDLWRSWKLHVHWIKYY